ncbi:Pol-like protein [Elysia marginata]|uniref:Pol-like protein n=1 Tax=Elysia marginata TaxID=1093978 RepID=A0AAV4HLF2_9GAST|nr:Pol-like protein [Elysia marginata]
MDVQAAAAVAAAAVAAAAVAASAVAAAAVAASAVVGAAGYRRQLFFFSIIGDFNTPSPLWGDERLDQRGKINGDFLLTNDGILLNDKVPTFVHSAYGSTSAIDLTIASPTVALDFFLSVDDDLCGSDHFLIILSSNTNVGQDDATFNFKKANWQLFGDLCLKSIDEVLTKHENPT